MKDEELKQEELNTPKSTESTSAADDVKFEENDNWKFDGVAHTLSDDFLSSVGVEDTSIYETAKRPTKVEKVETVAVEKKKKGIKGDKVLFAFVAVVMAIVIAVLAVLGSFYYNRYNSDERMNAGNVALEVGDLDVSLGMYNYYYTCISQNYISYASYYGLDATKPFDTQYTTDENNKKISWADKLKQETLNQVQYISAYYLEAVQKGITLTDTQKQNIKTNLESLKESATASATDDEAVSVDAYIADMYGDGCGYATLKKMLTQCYIAENYYQQKKLEQRVTSEEEKAFFEKHQDDYKKVGLAYLQIPYGDDYGLKEDEAVKNGQKYAKDVKTVDDMKKLIPTACKNLIDIYVAQGYAEDADSCAEMLSSNIEISISKSEDSLMEDATTWLYDSKTKVGDCQSFNDKDNQCVFVLLKTSNPAPDKSQVYSVRHILITPESDKDVDEEAQNVEYTDEQWAAAKKEAEKILKEFNEGDKTELSFAKFAEKYSKDVESTSAGTSGIYGGLTEGVALGNMVKEYEDWSIDKNRKYGDTGIVKSQYGYHIMFFVESTEKYLYDCKEAVYKEKEDKFINSFEIKEHRSVMKKAKVAEPTKEEESASTEETQSLE